MSTSGSENVKHLNAYGFAAAADIATVGTAGIANWEHAGKVFGKLGTGKKTDVTQSTTTAFRSKAATTAASDLSYIMVNILPTSKAAVTTTAAIVWDIRDVAFAASTDYSAPSQPGAATAPDATGAQYLAAGVAAAAVVASLY